MKGNSLGYRIKKDFQRNWSLYLLVLPVIIFYAIFMYKPMYGAIIAFKDYTPAKGVFGSEWVGMENFTRFFSSPYFGRLLRNTLLLSIYSIIFGFPAPIILALLLNEVKVHRRSGQMETAAARNPSRHRADHHHHVDSENGFPDEHGL